MIDVAEVKEWFRNSEEMDDTFLFDLRYSSNGDVFNIPTMPKGYQATVVARDTAIDYDSYGYGYTSDAYAIVAITDESGFSENFKIPAVYASYEGWEWKLNEIVKVSQQTKEVSVWEEV